MKYETIQDLTLPKIGFGTWKIGGGSSPNHSMDAKSLSALRYALEVGYTHIERITECCRSHRRIGRGSSSRVRKEARGTFYHVQGFADSSQV
jgi:diketogulonate reductase-like aldo/keto reductase